MSRQLARIEEWHGHDGSRSRKRPIGREHKGNLVGGSSQMQKFYKLRSDDLQLVRRFRESRNVPLLEHFSNQTLQQNSQYRPRSDALCF